MFALTVIITNIYSHHFFQILVKTYIIAYKILWVCKCTKSVYTSIRMFRNNNGIPHVGIL